MRKKREERKKNGESLICFEYQMKAVMALNGSWKREFIVGASWWIIIKGFCVSCWFRRIEDNILSFCCVCRKALTILCLKVTGFKILHEQ